MDNSTPNSKWPYTTFFVILLVILGVRYFYGDIIRLLERLSQRTEVIERVQSAGGWDAVRRDCVLLTEQNAGGFYSSPRFDTNDLPKCIAALKPLLVEYSPKNGCVRVKIFGMPSTGGYGTPYFGLEVDTSTNSVGYEHGTGYDNGGVIGNYHSAAKRVADGIYEIY